MSLIAYIIVALYRCDLLGIFIWQKRSYQLRKCLFMIFSYSHLTLFFVLAIPLFAKLVYASDEYSVMALECLNNQFSRMDYNYCIADMAT